MYEMKTAGKIFRTFSLSIFGLALLLSAVIYFGIFEQTIVSAPPKPTLLSQLSIILSQMAIIFGTLSSNINDVYGRIDAKKDIKTYEMQIGRLLDEVAVSKIAHDVVKPRGIMQTGDTAVSVKQERNDEYQLLLYKIKKASIARDEAKAMHNKLSGTRNRFIISLLIAVSYLLIVLLFVIFGLMAEENTFSFSKPMPPSILFFWLGFTSLFHSVWQFMQIKYVYKPVIFSGGDDQNRAMRAGVRGKGDSINLDMDVGFEGGGDTSGDLGGGDSIDVPSDVINN